MEPNRPIPLWASWVFFVFFVGTSQLMAQGPENSSVPGLADLTGPQKRVLLLIAREAVDAKIASRASREATVEPRLAVSQPMVASIYVDGKLRGRAWRLSGLKPLYFEARDLILEAISSPKVTDEALTMKDLERAEVGLAILSRYIKVKDDRDVPAGEAVIIYNGFIEWLALPSDVESSRAADLLSYACEQAGLRPNAWLIPQKTTIFSARVDEMRERYKVKN